MQKRRPKYQSNIHKDCVWKDLQQENILNGCSIFALSIYHSKNVYYSPSNSTDLNAKSVIRLNTRLFITILLIIFIISLYRFDYYTYNLSLSVRTLTHTNYTLVENAFFWTIISRVISNARYLMVLM